MLLKTEKKHFKPNSRPIACAIGVGVDSTAQLGGMYDRGIRPDLLLFADVGDEKQETYDYIPVMQDWLKTVGFPPLITVRNVVANFKHWPPYESLSQNCLTNGTLPSLAFGFKSCSLKWKVGPQNKYCADWAPAKATWAKGEKVIKTIGYDASPNDKRRYAHAQGMEDPAYEYWYPLMDWGWDRDRCKKEIQYSMGIAVPMKSACVYCPATKPAELHEHRAEYLKLIVIMEARARPRLEGLMSQEQLDVINEANMAAYRLKHGTFLQKMVIRAKRLAKGYKKVATPKEPKLPARKKEGDGCQGLWRKPLVQSKRPAMMTDYIRQHGLLPSAEIDKLQATVPAEIIDLQGQFANGLEIPNWHDFIELVTDEDGLDELIECGCSAAVPSIQLTVKGLKVAT